MIQAVDADTLEARSDDLETLEIFDGPECEDCGSGIGVEAYDVQGETMWFCGACIATAAKVGQDAYNAEFSVPNGTEWNDEVDLDGNPI